MPSRNHKLFVGSSYDRYLDVLLYLWPDIIKAYPDAELHICYGWELFDVITRTNPERQQWKRSVQQMMSQKGIFHHGRVGKNDLAKIRRDCGIWAYPTYFSEIFCITALECQRDGLVPVTMNSYALKETVGAGVKVEGDIKDPRVKDKYLEELLALMGDRKRFREESRRAVKFARKFTIDKIAPKWIEEFKKPLSMPSVTIITNTIRTGFWNIMSDNLAKQTYQNIKEWIILDDYKEDRSEIAAKYAKRYNLPIRYIRGDKVLGKYKRRYGLVRANNKAARAATGDLLVFLQDFILIPTDGIERLVDIHRHHPNALLAPTDDYWHCTPPDKTNKEDWFNGETNVITTHSWRNVRNTYDGLRRTENAFDFEMNWSAIPRKIVESLNGWWEYFDDGLGYDNTDIAYRAQRAGYYVLIDDTNVATCINLWPHIGGTAENITERERNLGLPYWLWLKRQMDNKTFPLIRDEAIDEKIDFKFKVPDEITDDQSSEWINKNAKKIVASWPDYKK